MRNKLSFDNFVPVRAGTKTDLETAGELKPRPSARQRVKKTGLGKVPVIGTQLPPDHRTLARTEDGDSK